MDTELLQTLEILRYLDRFNDWMYSKFVPHLGHNVLEVGCGIGTFTSRLLQRGPVTAMDPSPEAIEYVKRELGSAEGLDIRLGDITRDETVAALTHGYDSGLMVNVLEHIADEHSALRNIHRALRPGGRLIVLSPWGRWLWGTLDDAFGHERRYTRRTLRTAMEQAGYRVVSLRPFNALGIPGWLVAGRLLHHRTLKPGPARAYSMMLPVARRMEDAVRPPFGLSLIAVGERI